MAARTPDCVRGLPSSSVVTSTCRAAGWAAGGAVSSEQMRGGALRRWQGPPQALAAPARSWALPLYCLKARRCQPASQPAACVRAYACARARAPTHVPRGVVLCHVSPDGDDGPQLLVREGRVVIECVRRHADDTPVIGMVPHALADDVAWDMMGYCGILWDIVGCPQIENPHYWVVHAAGGIWPSDEPGWPRPPASAPGPRPGPGPCDRAGRLPASQAGGGASPRCALWLKKPRSRASRCWLTIKIQEDPFGRARAGVQFERRRQILWVWATRPDARRGPKLDAAAAAAPAAGPACVAVAARRGAARVGDHARAPPAGRGAAGKQARGPRAGGRSRLQARRGRRAGVRVRVRVLGGEAAARVKD
jgi:hypothetical protein